MGLLDDAKDAAEATGKKIGETVDDAKERVSDRADEAKADADVKKAERERDKSNDAAEAERVRRQIGMPPAPPSEQPHER